VEPDSDDETSAACAFVECQLTEQDSDTVALNKVNSHFEVSMLCMLLPSIFKICCSLTLSRPVGHICPTYKESFQVR